MRPAHDRIRLQPERQQRGRIELQACHWGERAGTLSSLTGMVEAGAKPFQLFWIKVTRPVKTRREFPDLRLGNFVSFSANVRDAV